MKRLIRLLPAAVLLLATGCLDYSEQLMLNWDGSGTMSLRIAVDKAARAKAETMAADMADDNDADAGELPFTFEKGNDGLWHYTRGLAEKEGDYAMNGAPAGAPAGMGEGTPSEMGMPNIPGMPPGLDPAKIAEMSPEEQKKMVEEMMKGLQGNMEKLQQNMSGMEESAHNLEAEMDESMKGRKVRFEVRFPGKVIDSNGSSVSGKKVVWEYPLTALKENSMPDEFTATVKP